MGCYIVIDMLIKGIRYTIANFYGPNKDDTSSLLAMFKDIDKFGNDNIIIRGNFNTALNLRDKKGTKV